MASKAGAWVKNIETFKHDNVMNVKFETFFGKTHIRMGANVFTVSGPSTVANFIINKLKDVRLGKTEETELLGI